MAFYTISHIHPFTHTFLDGRGCPRGPSQLLRKKLTFTHIQTFWAQSSAAIRSSVSCLRTLGTSCRLEEPGIELPIFKLLDNLLYLQSCTIQIKLPLPLLMSGLSSLQLTVTLRWASLFFWTKLIITSLTVSTSLAWRKSNPFLKVWFYNQCTAQSWAKSYLISILPC